jgi:hypothetical protein
MKMMRRIGPDARRGLVCLGHEVDPARLVGRRALEVIHPDHGLRVAQALPTLAVQVLATGTETEHDGESSPGSDTLHGAGLEHAPGQPRSARSLRNN